MGMLAIKNKALDFKQFYLTYKDKVFKYAFLHFKDEEMAADLVQEVFSKLWNKWDTLDEEGNMRAYLYTASRNLVFDELRKVKVRLDYSTTDANKNNEMDNSNEESIAYKDLENLYKQAIRKLPKARLEVFLLSKEAFLNNQEIADQLGISVNTVRDQLVKANKSVRQYLIAHMKDSIALLIFLRIF